MADAFDNFFGRERAFSVVGQKHVLARDFVLAKLVQRALECAASALSGNQCSKGVLLARINLVDDHLAIRQFGIDRPVVLWGEFYCIFTV